MKKQLTLSLIIPAYNEEDHLKACLDSIAQQTIKPDEVIVVDNNSTDKTTQIAKNYSFVRLLKEPKQGVIFARDRGFNAAKSDIIGRINADSELCPDWVARVKEDFLTHPGMAAITGPSLSLTLPPLRWHTRFWSNVYYKITDAYFRVTILWGANMAIARKSWQAIQHESIHDIFTHEDQDISLALAKHRLLVVRDQQLLIRADYDDFHYWPKFKSYMLRRWYTKSKHFSEYANHELPLLPLWRLWPIYLLIVVPGLLFILTSLGWYKLSVLLKRVKD